MYQQKPKVIRDVTPEFDWDSHKIWQLNLPTQEVSVEQLLWQFDLPVWEKEGTDDWNLTPWEVIRNPEQEPTHYQKILQTDLRFPLDIVEHKGKLRILDGMHRLAKAYLEGRKTIAIRIVPPEMFDAIKK